MTSSVVVVVVVAKKKRGRGRGGRSALARDGMLGKDLRKNLELVRPFSAFAAMRMTLEMEMKMEM